MSDSQRSHASFVCLIALVTALAGCGAFGDVPVGEVDVCFDAPGDYDEEADPAEQFQQVSENLSSEVIFDRPADEVENLDVHCSPTRVLRVRANNQVWTVGYAAHDEDGADITPDPGLSEGDSIRLVLERDLPWWTEHAFAVVESGQLGLAMNDGLGARLPADAIEGLSVEEGETYGLVDNDSIGCGTIEAQRLVFSAESTRRLDSAERGHPRVAFRPDQHHERRLVRLR